MYIRKTQKRIMSVLFFLHIKLDRKEQLTTIIVLSIIGSNYLEHCIFNHTVNDLQKQRLSMHLSFSVNYRWFVSGKLEMTTINE
jgi:hypothetical protein